MNILKKELFFKKEIAVSFYFANPSVILCKQIKINHAEFLI